MYHVELRAADNNVRAFNLTEEQVKDQIVGPLLADRSFVYQELEWDPRSLRLLILEGPQLRPDQLGFGRSWPNAERSSTDVTASFLSGSKNEVQQSGVREALKQRLLGRISAAPVPLAQITPLAGDLFDGHRASQQLAVAEMAVWELLHEDKAVLLIDGQAVAKGEWERLVLSADTWFTDVPVALGALG